MAYEVVRTAGNLFDLERNVNEACKKGWQPLGAPFREGADRLWCQAMVREEQQGNTLNLREKRR